MKKLISAMLCLAILVGVLAFAGCKQKNNDETTVPPDTDAAIDNIIGDDTEPALEDTTQSAQPAQSVRPAQQVLPTNRQAKSPLQQPRSPRRPLSPPPRRTLLLLRLKNRPHGRRPAHTPATRILPQAYITLNPTAITAELSLQRATRKLNSILFPTVCLSR